MRVYVLLDVFVCCFYGFNVSGPKKSNRLGSRTDDGVRHMCVASLDGTTVSCLMQIRAMEENPARWRIKVRLSIYHAGEAVWLWAADTAYPDWPMRPTRSLAVPSSIPGVRLILLFETILSRRFDDGQPWPVKTRERVYDPFRRGKAGVQAGRGGQRHWTLLREGS